MPIQTNQEKKCQQGCSEKEILIKYWWEDRLIQPLWKSEICPKLQLSYDPGIPFLCI
jgi:hypothetical protein